MKTTSSASVVRLALVLFFAAYLSSCSSNPSAPNPAPKTSHLPTTMVGVTDPARGAMVIGGTDGVSLLAATGIACDSLSEVTSVTVDGDAVALSGSPPCLDFDTQLDSRWGVNVIQGSSKNAAGETATFAQSYLRSPSYFANITASARALRAPASAPADTVPLGVYIQLNPKTIDDGVRATSSSIPELDDLASILDWQLKQLDIDAQIPDPLKAEPGLKTCSCVFPINDIVIHKLGYGIDRGTLLYTDPSVDYILPRNGGFNGGCSITNLSMPVAVTGYLGNCVTSCTDRVDHHATSSGTIYADKLVMDLSIDVSLGPDGYPATVVTVSNFTITGLRLDIDWGPLEFLDPLIGLSNMTTDILNLFKNWIETVTANLIQNQFNILVAQFIRSLEPPASVVLPPPMNTTLNFTSQLDRIDIDFGGARFGIAASVAPAETVLTSPEGSIRRDGGGPPVFSSTPYGLGVGLKDDMLNQFLWAAWRGGALEIDDLSALGVNVPAGYVVSMSAMLPPVVMPGTNGHPVDVGLGDVYIEATPTNGDAAGVIAWYASAVAGATLTVDNDNYRFVLTVAPDPLVALQIVQLPENKELATLTAQYTALFENVFAKALGTLVESYPLPTMYLAGIGLTGVPPDAKWELGAATVDRQDPYTTLTGDVVVR